MEVDFKSNSFFKSHETTENIKHFGNKIKIILNMESET